MLKPHTFKKMVTLTEDEWMSIYATAKKQGIDPVKFIKTAAIAAAKLGTKP